MAEENEEKKPELKKRDWQESFLKSTEDLVARNEKAVAEMAKLVERNEELAARNLLGGKSDHTPEPVKKEETPQEYANRLLRGGK